MAVGELFLTCTGKWIWLTASPMDDDCVHGLSDMSACMNRQSHLPFTRGFVTHTRDELIAAIAAIQVKTPTRVDHGTIKC